MLKAMERGRRNMDVDELDRRTCRTRDARRHRQRTVGELGAIQRNHDALEHPGLLRLALHLLQKLRPVCAPGRKAPAYST